MFRTQIDLSFSILINNVYCKSYVLYNRAGRIDVFLVPSKMKSLRYS